jgi:hypothetical protein
MNKPVNLSETEMEFCSAERTIRLQGLVYPVWRYVLKDKAADHERLRLCESKIGSPRNIPPTDLSHCALMKH